MYKIWQSYLFFPRLKLLKESVILFLLLSANPFGFISSSHSMHLFHVLNLLLLLTFQHFKLCVIVLFLSLTKKGNNLQLLSNISNNAYYWAHMDTCTSCRSWRQNIPLFWAKAPEWRKGSRHQSSLTEEQRICDYISTFIPPPNKSTLAACTLKGLKLFLHGVRL